MQKYSEVSKVEGGWGSYSTAASICVTNLLREKTRECHGLFLSAQRNTQLLHTNTIVTEVHNNRKTLDFFREQHYFDAKVFICGPDSVAGTATGYRLDGLRIDSRWQ